MQNFETSILLSKHLLHAQAVVALEPAEAVFFHRLLKLSFVVRLAGKTCRCGCCPFLWTLP